jgi:hypothetical protein
MSDEPRLVHVPPGTTLTPELYDEFEREFERTLNDPDAAKKWRRQTLRDNLPRRARIRLAVTSSIDLTAIWLVEHGHIDTARRLWQVTGLARGHKR